MVVEGYGILQPRIAISVQSAARCRMAALYSGQTGFDIYTRAVSDVYQDLFGEGIFTGKGIYEVDAIRAALERRFPENTLLSHDLIEGAYARSALVSDVELVDDYPSHFSAYSRRRHRWMRGDWQIMRWVRARVPGVDGRPIPNPITLISRWKILDNLRRSLLEPSILLLLIGGWFFLPGEPADWTLATMGMMFLPAFLVLLFAPIGAPWTRRGFGPWARQSAHAFGETIAVTFCGLVFLLHQALISLDATVRSLDRVFVSRRKLLEWETAAESEASGVGPGAVVDTYLKWTPWIAAAIGALLCLLRPAAVPSAAPILALWIASRGFSTWLNRRPRPSLSKLSPRDTELLRESADRIWRFFHDWSSASTNWMIPDNVNEDGTVDLRLSPTNLGMLLNARVAAVHLGLLRLPEFIAATRLTLNRVLALPKYRGHLLNWYDINSLEPIAPLYVSTVDSGNLAASLWTLKQAALAFAGEWAVKRGVTREMATELTAIAEDCHRLVHEMDFRFLYRRRRKLLSVGYDLAARQVDSSCYDLLASEARTAAFVAIAKGDIPQESWFHLGRALTGVRGERVLLSWTGTMFEYLMPNLWMRAYPDTILGDTAKAVVRVQREYARHKGTPWGISESAGGRHEYAPFGIPALALKPANPRRLVISPYSTFLAASVDTPSVLSNLVRMQEFEWTGRYGFYEAIEYSEGGASPLRLWMAHHQGMSLLALANLLFDNPIQQHFHREPQVLATERLLHERLTADVVVDEETAFADPVEAAGAA
jgi:cyclic beta-1,2-glucan synthetase